MAHEENIQTITVTAPEGYKPEEGKPISFNVPVSGIDITKFAPKDIAEKEYFKKVKTSDDLFKMLDGATELIGKKPKYAVPAADAPDEEWDSFFAVSRAQKADDYKIEENPNAPAELKMPADFQKEVRQMFFDAGLTPRQASKLQIGYDALQMKLFEGEKTRRAAIDKNFNDMMKSIVGEGDAATKSYDRAKKVLGYLLPKELHPFIGKANNEGLAMMAALTQVIEKKYMKEDELPKDPANAGKTEVELRGEAAKLMIERDKMDPMKVKDKKEIQDKIDAIYHQISAMK